MSRSQQFVAGREIPSVSYRDLPALNQSMLKLFASNPVDFVKQYKLGYKGKEKKGTALVIGDIVDFYILDCGGDENVFDHTHDRKFVLYGGDKGMAQAFVLADALFEITKECIGEDGKINCSFETRFSEAFERVKAEGKYKGKSEDDALLDFTKKAEDYFKMLLANMGKTVVEASLLQKAKMIAHMLLEDEFTSFLFKKHPDEERLPKFPIEFEHKGFPCKAEIDYLIIDHKNKLIYPKDIKTTYDNERFIFSYLEMGYYIQAAFYDLAVASWAAYQGLEGYGIMPMEFIVGDTSAAIRRPVRYQLTFEDLSAGYKGFIIAGTRYRGVNELIEGIKWAEETGIWDISREVHEKRGELRLNLKYDS